MFKKITLDNGLRIITAPMKGTNTITVLVLCGTGSDYESREIGGISHFLEHMFFKGTKNRPNQETITRELDGIGAVSNAFTSHEMTGYFVKAGKTHFEKALDILSDIYRNSVLPAEEIEKERQVIIEERNMYLDTPQRHIWDVWEALLYGDQPAGWDVIGTEKTIRGVTREEFVNYFYNQYTAQNTIVIVAGNVDEGTAIDRVTAYFGDIRNEAPIRKKGEFHEEQSCPNLSVQYKESDQTHMILGFRGYDAFHPKRYMAEVAATVLGGSWSSRMFNTVRNKLGLAYTIKSAHESLSNRGYAVTYVGTSHINAEKALRAMMGEYKKLRDELVSEEELHRVKEYIRGTTLIGIEASDSVAEFVGTEEVVVGKPLTIDEVFAIIDAVTPENIQTVANELFVPEKLNLAVIGPYKETDTFKEILNGF